VQSYPKLPMIDFSTKARRSKLAGGMYWQRVGRTLSLGYRKGVRTGMWWAREFVGRSKDAPNRAPYRKASIGIADDGKLQADGVDVLDHAQAIQKATDWADKPVQRHARSLTVEHVVGAYLKNYMAHTRDESNSQVGIANNRIIPALGGLNIVDMASDDLLQWRNSLVTGKNAVEKSTANRIWTVLRAALNYGYAHMKVPDPDRWRRIKPFPKTNKPRAEYVTAKEARKLIKHMDADFRDLALGALYTGGRYRELTMLRVKDVNKNTGEVRFRFTKSGDERDVPLSAEGLVHFKNMVKRRGRNDFVFVKSNGDHWGKSQQTRRMADAIRRAKFDRPVNFHQFRHSYASALTQQGMNMRSIQHLLGHADMRITVQHYAHLQPKEVASQVKEFLPSFKGK
jgi:integrase